MLNNESTKVCSLEFAIRVLDQAKQSLNHHDYGSAQVMVAVAKQVLEELQLDFDRHFKTEEMLRQLLKQSSN